MVLLRRLLLLQQCPRLKGTLALPGAALLLPEPSLQAFALSRVQLFGRGLLCTAIGGRASHLQTAVAQQHPDRLPPVTRLALLWPIKGAGYKIVDRLRNIAK